MAASRPWRLTKEQVAAERAKSREILRGGPMAGYGHRGGVDSKLLDVCMKLQLAKDVSPEWCRQL